MESKLQSYKSDKQLAVYSRRCRMRPVKHRAALKLLPQCKATPGLLRLLRDVKFCGVQQGVAALVETHHPSNCPSATF